MVTFLIAYSVSVSLLVLLLVVCGIICIQKAFCLQDCIDAYVNAIEENKKELGETYKDIRALTSRELMLDTPEVRSLVGHMQKTKKIMEKFIIELENTREIENGQEVDEQSPEDKLREEGL